MIIFSVRINHELGQYGSVVEHRPINQEVSVRFLFKAYAWGVGSNTTVRERGRELWGVAEGS